MNRTNPNHLSFARLRGGMPSRGWRIGALGGVEIQMDVSLLLIAFVVALTLATRLFPMAVPDITPAFAWLLGVITAGVFIASVLWHEMAHALMAMRYRLPVAGIVLYLFGGVAYITRDPERPAHEFWIAIAGPLSSLFLGVFFWLPAGLPGAVGAACAWLSISNLTLAFFNMLPGFPLDGGRVLRATLWHFGGSYRRASRLASRIGQGMAGLFALAGVFFLAEGPVFNGLWFMLIAAFLYGVATSSYRMYAADPLPMKTTVGHLLRRNVPFVEPTMPLALLAWRYLDHARDQAFPVLDNDSLVGMITLAQIDHLPRTEWGKHRVGTFMIPRENLVIVRADDDLESAMQALDKASMDHALVFDSTHFVGTLNRRDIVYRT